MSTRGRILVVDDERTIRQMFQLVLGEAGYEVAEAASGEEGVDLVRAQPWDLIFLDLVLPGLDGVETYKRMKALRDVLIIVMMSAYFEQMESRLKETLSLEALQACLRKPFSNADILAVVARVLGPQTSGGAS